MSQIHVSPETKAQMEKEREAKYKAFEKALVMLMIEHKVAVVPKIEYMTNGIMPVLAFEVIPDEKVEEYKKRVEK